MSAVSASDWVNGIALSILASIIGGASKLSIRKSWLMEANFRHGGQQEQEDRSSTPEASNHADPHTSTVEETITESSTSFSRLQDSSSHSSSEPRLHYRATTSLSLEEGFQDETASTGGGGGENDHAAEVSTRRRKWLAYTLRGCGMIGMTFLNPLCCVLAMNYASPSILAPFSGLTLVWIVLLSQPLIGERPTRTQIVAACLIVLGQVLIAVFGDHTNDEGVTLREVKESYLYPPFLTYLVGLGLWMLLLVYWIRFGVNPTLKRFSWGVAGGSITGLQNFLKDGLTILKAVDAEEDASLPWYFPLMLVLAAVSAFGGLLFLTACMKRYDATYSSAMFVGSFVVSASIMSATHYATFSHMSTLWNWVFYPFGLMVLMAGVWILVHERQQRGVEVEQPESQRGVSRSVELQEPLVSESRNVSSSNLSTGT